MTAIIIVLAAVSLCVGKYNISFEEISGMFASSGDIPDMTYQVFFTLRLPRTLMAITAGAGLGLAGAVYQKPPFRANAPADPLPVLVFLASNSMRPTIRN